MRPLLSFLQPLAGKDIAADLKKWTKARSLDANAYAWVLIDKIAAAMSLKKIEVYRSVIREIGGNSDVLTMRTDAFEAFARRWESNGDGWQAEIMSEAKTPGYTHVRAYYGSSVYDVEQMSSLIDALIQDAKELGIEALPPHEIERMMGQWGNTDKPKPPT